MDVYPYTAVYVVKGDDEKREETFLTLKAKGT